MILLFNHNPLSANVEHIQAINTPVHCMSESDTTSASNWKLIWDDEAGISN